MFDGLRRVFTRTKIDLYFVLETFFEREDEFGFWLRRWAFVLFDEKRDVAWTGKCNVSELKCPFLYRVRKKGTMVFCWIVFCLRMDSEH